MKALIDADVLRYEIGHSAQYVSEETGNTIVRDWDFCKDLLDQKIHIINEQVRADEPPCLYLTADERTINVENRRRKTEGLPTIAFTPNFRDAIATVKPYKSTRHNEKPAHYNNLTSYIINFFDHKIGNGVEADDLMAMDQTDDTIICSRDKDLRQVPGNHYSWECGKQKEIGPLTFGKKGYIEEKLKVSATQFKKDGTPVIEKSCFGGGEMFFLYQLLVGDPVDTIPGCPKVGHVKAMALLEEVDSRKAAYEAVRGCYSAVYGEDDITHLTEQARLLWLLRSEDDVWEYPYEEKV